MDVCVDLVCECVSVGYFETRKRNMKDVDHLLVQGTILI